MVPEQLSTFVKLGRLIIRLCNEFQLINYNEKLIATIEQRTTQGSDKGIKFYINSIESLLMRLNCSVSETAQLKVIIGNLLPCYQFQLGLIEVNSIHHFQTLCRQFEARRNAIKNFKPPNRNSRASEACVETKTPSLLKAEVVDLNTPSNAIKKFLKNIKNSKLISNFKNKSKVICCKQIKNYLKLCNR